jgi:pimeloyl-ACP methyl ester carboxylesterase
MINPRVYGRAPFRVVLLHGGPGAHGEMEPVARELEGDHGVLEPLQTERSLAGQVAELRRLLIAHADPPVDLIGFSWGAWLGYVLAAHEPTLVAKLILIGSGPYHEEYVARIEEARLARLDPQEQAAYRAAIATLAGSATEGKPAALARLGELAAKTDSVAPIAASRRAAQAPHGGGNPFHAALEEAQALRRSGALLELAGQIESPVVAIHGDADPHPADGVAVPLGGRIARFRMILLERCGHKPWIEQGAREAFYRVLRQEIDRAP